jgi:hypothetical protein
MLRCLDQVSDFIALSVPKYSRFVEPLVGGDAGSPTATVLASVVTFVTLTVEVVRCCPFDRG